jgi:predicted membrane-bound dolichyl-phosphate-mannose-protein mannosyltransferase
VTLTAQLPWYRRLVARIRQLLGRRHAPMVMLALVCVAGVGLRSFHLGIPPAPGGTIFDESYYVNAARVIAGVHLGPSVRYSGAAPAGDDPNGEHPQLAKLAIAGSIELLGDNAIAWRITAVIFALAGLLALYWLVRCCGGSQWLGVGVTALAAFENLWLVSGRIAVLDIYCVPFMLAGAAFYLRRQPIMAGIAIGVGGCFKETAILAVLVLFLLEAMRAASAIASGRRKLAPFRRLARPVTMGLVTVVTFASVLAVADAIATPYNSGHPVTRGEARICAHLWLWRSSCNHIAFILRYGNNLSSPHGPQGIASYPWEWWIDVKGIPYYTEDVTVTVTGKPPVTTTVINFRGLISRVLLFTSWLGILMSVYWAIRRRDDMSFLVIAWILGTWFPLALLSLFEQRTTYLYYMVETMPALYIAVGRLLAWRRVPRPLVVLWSVVFILELLTLYPFRTFSGS